MIPTEEGEAGNVCKDNENGKKRYNRIGRSNELVGNQSKTENREKKNKLISLSILEVE